MLSTSSSHSMKPPEQREATPYLLLTALEELGPPRNYPAAHGDDRNSTLQSGRAVQFSRCSPGNLEQPMTFPLLLKCETNNLLSHSRVTLALHTRNN